MLMNSIEQLHPLDGWRQGLPRVEINDHVLAKRGMPQVDFDGVKALLGDELGLAASQYPTIGLVGSPSSVTSKQMARYKRGEARVELDVIALQSYFGHEERDEQLTVGLSHEAYHHKDALKRPVRTYLENWGPADGAAGVSQLLATVGELPFFWSMAVGAGAFAAGKLATMSQFYYQRNPYEQRAIEFADQPHIKRTYGKIISFEQ